MTPREILTDIFAAGVAAVAPDKALMRLMAIDGETLYVDGQAIDLAGKRLFVVGAGKGAAPMADALEHLLGGKITSGTITVKKKHGLPLRYISVTEASHPIPDENGKRGAEAMLQLANRAEANDLVIALFTGGASALTPAPALGLSMADLQNTTELLLRSGADIQEVNAVRKHCSRFSGGRLARAAAPAPLISLIVSDVIGDPLDVIASGPTAPDPSTYEDAISVLTRRNLIDTVPHPVLLHLTAGAEGRFAETPKPGDPIFRQVMNRLVATNAQALEAAAQKARGFGYDVTIVPEPMRGEARECAGILVRQALKARQATRPVCILAGGETTVTLTGQGTGGRNQEMALAAAILLRQTHGLHALFAGTDGTDGPTEAAGGFACSDSFAGMEQIQQGMACRDLDDNNSHHALSQSGELFISGPTLTNVMDMAIILVDPAHQEAAPADAGTAS